MQKSLSPLILKILRLDHTGWSPEDIADEVKMSVEEVNRSLGNYRVRYFLSALGRKKAAFLLDVYQGMKADELAKKYNVRKSIIVNVISHDKFRSNTEKITIRCNNCTNMMTFDVSMKPYHCPRCGEKL